MDDYEHKDKRIISWPPFLNKVYESKKELHARISHTMGLTPP